MMDKEKELLNGVVKNIDVDAIAENVEAGKVDFQSLFNVLDQLLTPKEVEQLVNNAKVIAETKNGGKVTQDDIADVLNGVIDVAEIQERVAEGKVDISALKNELPNLLGEDKSEELLKNTNKLVKKMAKDSK